MKKNKILLVSFIIFISVCFSSCISSTNVTFNTDEEGASVFVDGELIGETPISKKMSNGVWEDPEILIKKEGYKILRASVNKEIKAGNIAFGVLLNPWAFLWCHGPKKNQYYMLTPETSNK